MGHGGESLVGECVPLRYNERMDNTVLFDASDPHLPHSDQGESPTAPAACPLRGYVRWFDAAKRIGVIEQIDGPTIFVPPYGLSDGQEALVAGQLVMFTVKANAKGSYADEVQPTGDTPMSASDLVATVEQIAAVLAETSPHAITQIRRIVRAIGPKAAHAAVAEALHIEERGGMLLPDGSRRRTLGGVFFTIVRDQLSPAQQAAVFPPLPQWNKAKPFRSATDASPLLSTPPPVAWADRTRLLTALRSTRGKATSVKVTIIGRPDQVDAQAQFTLLTMTQSGRLPALPKGLPLPEEFELTTYAIYIGKKQWKAVAEALTNPEDALIVEGVQMYDPETGTIAVFAMKTTTKLLQQGSRPSKPPET